MFINDAQVLNEPIQDIPNEVVVEKRHHRVQNTVNHVPVQVDRRVLGESENHVVFYQFKDSG